MSAALIAKFNETNSRLDKEKTLKEIYAASTIGVESATMFLILLKMTYDPFITFGIKKVEPTSGYTSMENPWDDFLELLNKLASRSIKGNAARRALTDMSSRFDSDEWNDMCAQVIQRDLRIGITATTSNKLLKGTPFEIPIFSCQLATNCEGNPAMKGKKQLQQKLDGVRMLAVVTFDEDDGASVTCFSRNGKMLLNFSHIEKQLIATAPQLRYHGPNPRGNGFVLDGEVMSANFQALMKQLYRKTNLNTADAVFNVFDILPLDDFQRGYWNMQQGRRTDILVKLSGVFASMPNVALLPHITVDLDTAEGVSIMNEYAYNTVAAGFGGIMIKSVDAPYVCNRSTYWLKYKPVHDYDLTVVSVEEGTGKNAGRVGALVCEGLDGASGKYIKVNVGSGFSDEERIEWWNNPSLVLSKTCTILTDGITQNQDGSYSLRFPRLSHFRNDK